MLVCWSVGGGSGTSVVGAGLAVAASTHGERSLVVDLGGDQPLIFGRTELPGPGLSEWARSSPEVGLEALARLELEVEPGISLLPRGRSQLGSQRVSEVVEALRREARFVVVDAGRPEPGGFAAALVAAATRSLLVVRACPIAIHRLTALPARPDGIVVVRERNRSVTWQEVAAAAGTPVLAELEVDPAVAAAVDAGLDRRALPRRFVRVLDGLR